MIFQHFNLLMQRTALDNICFPMEIAGIRKKEARKKAMEYLEIVGTGGQSTVLSGAAFRRSEAESGDRKSPCL